MSARSVSVSSPVRFCSSSNASAASSSNLPSGSALFRNRYTSSFMAPRPSLDFQPIEQYRAARYQRQQPPPESKSRPVDSVSRPSVSLLRDNAATAGGDLP